MNVAVSVNEKFIDYLVYFFLHKEGYCYDVMFGYFMQNILFILGLNSFPCKTKIPHLGE